MNHKKVYNRPSLMAIVSAAVILLLSCSGDNPTGPAKPGEGKTGWFWQNPIPQGNDLYAISFTDTNNGTAVGENGTILRTNNGGASWKIQTSGTSKDLLGVSLTDANKCTTVGRNGTILRTTNGGWN
ncbi:MAG: YCF48-related protein [Candidatus Zixiibacteriota bacterium]